VSKFSLPSPVKLLFAALLLFAFHAPAAMADTGPWALFDGSAAISDPDADDSTNVELGARFTVDAPPAGAYWLTKVRYWRAPNRPINANRVNVYDSSGRQVARGAYDVQGGARGIVDVPLETRLRLTPGTRYTVSYSAPTGHYPVDRGAFASARTAGPVHFPADAGVYRYGGGYPTSSWESTSYYVTPVVTFDAATPPQTPAADGAAGPWSLLTDSTEIVEREANDPNKVEVGVRFKVDAPATGAYVVKAVRVFRARSTPENWVYIYDDDRKIVARGEWLTEGGPSGVVEVKLTTPLTLRPGVEYTASYLANWGFYADEPHGFDEGRSVGPVHFPPNAGVYQYGGGFPGDSWASSNYYVSPVVSHDATATSPAEPPSTGPWSLFDGSTTIANPAADDSDKVELGVRFSVAQPPAGAYVVRAVRFYRAPLHPMVENRVFVYDEDGSVAARGVAIGEGGPSGVVDVLLDAPLRLTPGRTYTASYVAVNGHYASDRGAFAASRTKGPVGFPADAGVYRYGGGFPTSSWQSTSYYVSPIVALDT
jgi:hypothetical protein